MNCDVCVKWDEKGDVYILGWTNELGSSFQR